MSRRRDHLETLDMAASILDRHGPVNAVFCKCGKVLPCSVADSTSDHADSARQALNGPTMLLPLVRR